MWETLKKIYNHRDLRNKILYVLGILVIFRILAHIPVPGIDLTELKSFFERNQLFGMLNLFSGGAMRNFSIVMMGVGPYITSSIIFQLLGMIVPSLEALQKEGEYGRKKINQYTRLATVPLAIMQSYAMITLLKNQGVIGNWSVFELITMLITMTAGTMLLMWLGELISEKGIGNGISLIITLGIIGGVPASLQQTLAVMDTTKIIGIIVFAVLAVIVTALIVSVNEAEREIPVTYARRVRGHKTYGGVDTFLPIKVNIGGVIPIIFALSMMIIPGLITKFFEQAKSETIANIATFIGKIFQDNSTSYGVIYFVLVVLFTYFYASVVFKPDQVSDNLQKQGGFVPGLRPGKETADYLGSVLYKITFIGAIFLGFIAVLPYIVQSITNVQSLVLGGTGLLIVVSVVIDTIRQIKAQLVMRTYDQY
jgi:preprotein translocase subunit SecY